MSIEQDRPETRLAQIGSAFVFLTRITMPNALFKNGLPPLQHALWAFPLVGLVIGFIGATAIAGARVMGLPDIICVIVGLGAMVIATGGLHEDGLADVADGFGSHKQGAEIARIMKDSVIGSYGTIALILALMLRTTTIEALIAAPLFILLPLSCALGRSFVFVALLTTPLSPYASLGKQLARPHASICLFAVLILIPFVFGLSIGAVISGLLASIAAFIILRHLCMRKIAGLTGDVMGALIIVVETAFLIGYVSNV